MYLSTLHYLVCAQLAQVDYANFTRLNHTKAMIVVNGQFPGPAIRAREGDFVVVNVTNLAASPVTIHWLKNLSSVRFSLILEKLTCIIVRWIRASMVANFAWPVVEIRNCLDLYVQ